MNYQNLALAFKRINTSLQLPYYPELMGEQIAGGLIDKRKVDEILLKNGINGSLATVDFCT
jgi:hypothetical protein